MICEHCKKEHSGTYGAGRFCNEKCCRTYSSNINKKQKGKAISKAMKKRWKDGGHIQDKEKLKIMTIKAAHQKKINREKLFKSGKWSDLPLTLKKKRVLVEQNYCCILCNIKNWQDKPLT